jgi:release factor glutamine methyltransferase
MRDRAELVDVARTLGHLFAACRARLTAAGTQNPAVEARLLVEHFTGTTLIDAIRDPARPVGKAEADAVRRAVDRRIEGEPVYRIVGAREFYGLPLRLSPDTLEPRPDTEILVDLVLPFVRRVAANDETCRILDLGTGTGAIALALLDREPKACATATDISVGALATAAANADILDMRDRFSTLHSDWFGAVEGTFHLIVANPPYIATGELAGLHAEVRDHDPRRALDGGSDGLNAYRAIASGAPTHLAESGRVAVEIGHDQKAGVVETFEAAGLYLTDQARDLAGHDRALAFQFRRS